MKLLEKPTATNNGASAGSALLASASSHVMWQKKRMLLLSFGFLLVLLAGFAGIAVWSWYGNLEESVQGMGQMMPEGKLRRVMSPINGMVTKVYVKENQEVKAGEVLVELDPESTTIEETGITERLSLLEEEARALQAASFGQDVDQEAYGKIQGAWLEATRNAYKAQAEEARMAIDEAQHRYQEALARVSQTEAVLGTSEQLLEKYRALYQDGGIAGKDVSEYEQRVTSERGELAALRENVQAQRLALAQAKQKPQEVYGNYHSQILTRLAMHQQDIAQLRSEMAKARFTQKHLLIRAPIDGIINEQVIRGAGDVVEGGSPLLVLVPKTSKLIAEVKVTNKDLSYVRLRQRAALRLEAFPYQQFGRLYGTVESISPSSQQQQAEAHPGGATAPVSFYVLTIRPDKTVMTSESGKTFPIRSGMAVTADVIIRDKSILSFFIEPIQERLYHAFKDPSQYESK